MLLLNLWFICIPTVLSADSLSSSDSIPKITTSSTQRDSDYKAPSYPLVGFKEYENNPILSPNPDNEWESEYLYNPAAIVIDERVWLLYRAQNESKVSVIGLAWSDDGYSFTRYNQPILYPTESYELQGGTEDPRIIRVDGTFYLTYSGYDGKTSRLCMATSTDLRNWKKHGPILPNVNYRSGYPGWSKSGAILDEKVNGVYYMQYGDAFLYTANSTDLINWNYETNPKPFAEKVYSWEQALMESGAPPVKTRDGKWLKLYNGVSNGEDGYTGGQYSTGQMLIDPANKPNGPPVARLEKPLLEPTTDYETGGQVHNVIFNEGLVQFKGKWFNYFGQGDKWLGVATTDVQS